MMGATVFQRTARWRCSTTVVRYLKLVHEKPFTKAAIAPRFIVEDDVGTEIPKP